MSAPRLLVLALLLSPAMAAAAVTPAGSTAELANQPGTVEGSASILRAQVLLDRARFGPGEIDGQAGSNLRRALNGFQAARGLTVSGKLDAATWSALNADAAPALVAYTLTAEDVTGPYVEIPEDMMAKSELKSLGYESIGEALGERFHASPELLKRLSPDTDFSKADTVLHVPRTVGKTQSHGCVRLSNWDVLAVAAALDTSVPVVMQE